MSQTDARILIVEDEKIIGTDIAVTLQSIGYDVVGVCTSAEEALVEVNKHDPDLVLMDVMLSGPMSGVDAAKLISNTHKIPIVFLTALSDEETLERAKQAAPYGYLLKPFHKAELRSTLEMALARHRAEMRASSEGQQIAEAFRSMMEGVIATDLTGYVTFLNPAAEKITGWKSEEAIGKALHEVFRIKNTNGDAASQPGSRSGAPILLQTKNGDLVTVEDNTAPIKDEHGSLRGLMVLFRVSTSTEQDLPDPELADPDNSQQGSKTHLAGLIESIGDPLVAIDAAGNLSFVNGQAAVFLGRAREDLLGHSYGDAFPHSLRDKCGEEFGRVLDRGETREFELHDESAERWLSVTAYPFNDGALAILKDITAKKKEEERGSRIEKLESLGLLARGFAHNFNNLLTVLLGNLSLAEMNSDDPDEFSGAIGNARQASLEAQGLVQQLLVFAKGGAPIRRRVDIAKLLDEIFESISQDKAIDYNLDIGTELPPIEADPDQLRRLFLNLIHNAEDAMITGGELTLRAGVEVHPSDQKKTEPRMLVEVIDTGEGMDETTMSRAFDPYFSTKDSANASGIGLTVCKSIAVAHGGEISIFSTPDGGTTVRAALPIGDPKEDVTHDDADAAETRPLPTNGDKVRILVLEDEQMIRQLMVANLRSQGFEVDATEDGADTIEYYKKSLDGSHPYDLVIMDLSIPNGVGGASAMEKLRQMDPAVRAVVSSGYSDDPVMARHREYGFTAVLPKPYRPRELTKLVNKILGRSVESS